MAHSRWRLARIDPKKLETRRSRKWGYVMRGREASNYDGVVAEYASLDPWAAPSGIASRDGSWPMPAFGSPRPTLPRGHLRMIDGNHRADAGKITGVPVLVFVPADEYDGDNVRPSSKRRSAVRNSGMLRIAVNDDNPREIVFAARRDGGPVSTLVLKQAGRTDCGDDVVALRRRLRERPAKVWTIADVDVPMVVQREGIGTALYVAALRFAADNLDGIVVPHTHAGGVTSEAAHATWNRVRRLPGVESEGCAAYWSGSTSGAAR